MKKEQINPPKKKEFGDDPFDKAIDKAMTNIAKVKKTRKTKSTTQKT